MKAESLLKKFNTHIDKIYDILDEISALLEIDVEDDTLAEMSVTFREQMELALSENDECNSNDIVDYIREGL